MVSVLNRMPDEYEVKHQSLPEIRKHLERRSNPDKTESDVLLIAAKQKVFGNVVALAGVVLKDDVDLGKVAVVTEMAVAGRATGEQLGQQLIKECVSWSEEHSADYVLIDVPPEPGSTADQLFKQLDFESSSYGRPLLQLTEPEPPHQSYSPTL